MNPLKGLSAVALLLIFLVPIISVAAPVPIPVLKVSGGEDHALILTEVNTVWGCGDNQYRQLGDNTNIKRFVPVQVYDGDMNTDSNCLENIIEIAAGMTHSLALDVNNHVWAWGNNGYGQLGNPNPPISYSAVPIRVLGGEMGTPFLQNIICISAGRSGQHSLAIDANHFVWSWGVNGSGQLGNGKGGLDPETWDYFYEPAPVQVHAGQQNPGEPNAHPLRYIIKVSGGEEHSMALDANGFVWTWGDNEYYPSSGKGKLGINDISKKYITTPVKVYDVNNNSNGLRNIIAISAGWDHCMALEKIDHNDPNCKGRVYTWGRNDSYGYGVHYGGGRLGDGTSTNRAAPVMVHAGRQDPNHPNDIPLKNIIAISAGESHCIALEKLDVVNDSNCRGRVYTWGDNYYGQLGTGNSYSYTPVRVLAPDRNDDGFPDDLDDDPNTTDYLGDDVPIVSISAGYWHNLAVDQFGQTYVWGKGEYGRLGIGSADNINVPTPLYIYDLNVHNETQNKWYKRIQPAISKANNNDVIEVYEGYYGENLNIIISNKSITLKSRDPNNQSVVDNTRIYGSKVSTEEAVITLKYNSSIITGFTITNGGRGISCTNSSNPTITHCMIRDNVSTGVYVGTNNANAIITNNIIYHNGTQTQTDNAGVQYVKDGSSTTQIRNNTIVENTPYGIYYRGSGTQPNINSNIIWGNTSESLYAYGGGSFNNVNYNCIQNGYTGSGTGNISSDPCFRDADTDDYHLTNNSNCIDTGDPDFNSSTEKDIDGENRVIDVNVDMGADEFHFCSGRVDISPASPDGIVNFLDFAVLADAWMTIAEGGNYNDVVDFADDGVIDYGDLDKFCDCWLYVTGDYESGIGGQGQPGGGSGGGGPPSPPPVDANIIIRIVDINDNNEITINVGESITLYLRLTTTEQGSLGIFDVEAMISDTNLGSIDNREYDANDPNDPNNGTARILAEPRDPFFDYVGPGYEQPEGIALAAANLGAGFNDGNLAGFVFTCRGQGDVTLNLKNYLTDTYPKLESILIHQVDSNSQQMMMGGSGIEMESSSAAMENSQVSEDVDIDELVAWLDELWQTDETIRDSISEEDWQEFLESVESSQ